MSAEQAALAAFVSDSKRPQASASPFQSKNPSFPLAPASFTSRFPEKSASVTPDDPRDFFGKMSVWAGFFAGFAILQLITLAMKLNGDVYWYWGHVFTWTWVFLGLVGLVVIVSFLNIYFNATVRWLSFASASALALIVGAAIAQFVVLSSVLNRNEQWTTYMWHLVFFPSYVIVIVSMSLVIAYLSWPMDAYNVAFREGRVTMDDFAAIQSGDFWVPVSSFCGNKRYYEDEVSDDAERKAGLTKWFFHLGALVFLTGVLAALFVLVAYLDFCHFDESCVTGPWIVFLPIWITAGGILVPFSCVDFYHKLKNSYSQFTVFEDSDVSGYFEYQGAFAFCSLTSLFVVQSALVWAALQYSWAVSWHVVFIPAYVACGTVLVFGMCFCKNSYVSERENSTFR
jgi:hypothetical protein